MSRDPRSRRIYRILLRAFPASFRERYGGEMEETFLRMLERARVRGGTAVWAAWARVTVDVVARGSYERLRALRGRRAPRYGGNPPGTAGGRRTFRGGDPMGTVTSDVRYAVRALLRRPVFLLTAVATLALGIGANTAIFSVVNGLLIQPLPYPEPDELVIPWAEHRERGWSETDVNLADAWDWRNRAGVFEDLAVFNEEGLNLTGGDRPELVAGIRTTPNLFDVLGVEPSVGRDFTAEDGREGAPPTAVLTDGFWERRFARDPSILGSTMTLDGEPTTVVGVLPRDFAFLDERPDLFVPFRRDPLGARRGDHNMESVARLEDGVTLERARRAVNRVARELQREHPEQNAGWTAQLVPLREDLLGDIARRASLVLMGAVGFVLLMACTNVANLLLARAEARRGEIAVRSALGAGRGRIVLQLLAESAVLAVAGGLAGTALAYWGERAIVAGLPDNLPPVFEFGLDGTVLVFAVGVTVLAAALFGLVPALRATAPSAVELRSVGSGAGRGRASRRFGSFLVVAQTALAVVLLVGGGVMVRSVVGMTTRDMGFEPEGVLTFRITPPESSYPDAEAVTRFWDGIYERLRGLSGVEAVGAIHALPLGGSNWGGTFWIEGVEDPEADEGRSTRMDYISPGYLEAMGLDLVRGRDIGPADRADAPVVVLVNEAFADRFFPDGDAVGTDLLASGATGPATVVGVVEDHLERDVDDPPEPTLYFSLAQRPVRGRAVAMRTAGDPRALVEGVRRTVGEVDPDLPVHTVRTMRDLVDYRVAGFRLIAELMAVFGVVSLLLGAVGIYGVTAYGVGRRTRELGVRMAMGASRRRVVALVLKDGLVRSGIGLAVGLLAAFWVSGAMEGLLVGVSPTDPVTYTAVTALLLGVAFLGSWLPARRAAGVNPVRAIATE